MGDVMVAAFISIFYLQSMINYLFIFLFLVCRTAQFIYL